VCDLKIILKVMDAMKRHSRSHKTYY